MNDGYRHSMCRDCWNKRRPKKSSVGHETPESRRVQERCGFCLNEHRSGIYVAKNPSARELKCCGYHGSVEAANTKASQT